MNNCDGQAFHVTAYQMVWNILNLDVNFNRWTRLETPSIRHRNQCCRNIPLRCSDVRGRETALVDSQEWPTDPAVQKQLGNRKCIVESRKWAILKVKMNGKLEPQNWRAISSTSLIAITWTPQDLDISKALIFDGYRATSPAVVSIHSPISTRSGSDRTAARTLPGDDQCTRPFTQKTWVNTTKKHEGGVGIIYSTHQHQKKMYSTILCILFFNAAKTQSCVPKIARIHLAILMTETTCKTWPARKKLGPKGWRWNKQCSKKHGDQMLNYILQSSCHVSQTVYVPRMCTFQGCVGAEGFLVDGEKSLQLTWRTHPRTVVFWPPLIDAPGRTQVMESSEVGFFAASDLVEHTSTNLEQNASECFMLWPSQKLGICKIGTWVWSDKSNL